jgi:putative tricarboxylic transport membrane protein
MRKTWRKKMWYAKLIAGFTVLLLGILTTYFASLLPYTADFGPGPGFLPFWLGIIMTICAVPVIVAEFKSRDRSEKFFSPEAITGLKVLILIVAVFLILPVLGISVGLALITGGGMRIMGKHSWISCAITVAVTAVCIHYLFGEWLTIPLLKGIIGW